MILGSPRPWRQGSEHTGVTRTGARSNASGQSVRGEKAEYRESQCFLDVGGDPEFVRGDERNVAQFVAKHRHQRRVLGTTTRYHHFGRRKPFDGIGDGSGVSGQCRDDVGQGQGFVTTQSGE